MYSKKELRSFLVPREKNDHKGVFGHALVVAGSAGMSGAAVLCVKSCLRSGAGLVTAAVPESVQEALLFHAPEALSLALPESGGFLDARGLPEILAAHRKRSFDVLAIGPGLSRSPMTRRFLGSLLRRFDIPTVFDADALNIMADSPRIFKDMLLRRRSPAIFTPHPGEMARCLGVPSSKVAADRLAAAERLAGSWRGVALLKGYQSVVSDGARAAINPSGGPGLAKGGSGDVLTGLIAGLWAQVLCSKRLKNVGAFETAVLGAYLHGLAGDIAEKELTPWAMTAGDLIGRLPAAFRFLSAR